MTDRRDGALVETALVTTVAAAVILVSSWPAFRAWFFGEAFLYLGQYWGTGERFWAALLGPSDMVFFKPVCFAASLPWYYLLPPEPFGYHVRNYALTVAVLLLLHRVLLRLAPCRTARVLAVLLFAVSKVHLTTIGYLMIFDSILMLALLLVAVLSALRWCATGARRDHGLALGAAALCAFTKDYGIAALVVVLAIVGMRALDEPRTSRQPMIADWVLPLVVIGALRVALRYAVVGAMPWSNPFYAPQLSLAEAGRKGLTFLSALTNASFGWHDKTGAPGVGTLVAHLLPGGVADGANTVDAVVGTVVLLVLAASVVLGRRARRGFVVPAVWMAAFFAPPILVRNVQVYYAYEPLAGAAVLLAVAWSATSARCRRVVAATIAVVAAGGVASNHFALYDWQFAADSARMIVPVIADHRGTEVRSVSIVTADVPFWRWTLTADLKAPMIEFLLGRPGTPVRFYDRAALAAAIPPLDRAHLVLDADAGFAPAVVPRR